MGWYAAISLLSDIRVRFLAGFVLVAIIVAIILILVEMNIREKARNAVKRLEQTTEDKIKIFVTSDKTVQDKLEFLDKFAKQYFYDIHNIPVTSSYSFIINELKDKGSKDEIEFCKEMFACFYSNIKIDDAAINSLARVLIAMENSRPENKKKPRQNKDVVKQIQVKQKKESDKKEDKKLNKNSNEKKKSLFSFFNNPKKTSLKNKKNFKDAELIKDFYDMQVKEQPADSIKNIPNNKFNQEENKKQDIEKKPKEIQKEVVEKKVEPKVDLRAQARMRKAEKRVRKRELKKKKQEEKIKMQEDARRKREIKKQEKKRQKEKAREEKKIKKIKSYSVKSKKTIDVKPKKVAFDKPIEKKVSGDDLIRESNEGLAQRIIRKKQEQLEKNLTEFNFG